MKEQRRNYEQLLTTKLESLYKNDNNEFWKCLKQMRGSNHGENEELPLTESSLTHYEQLYHAPPDKDILNESDTINGTSESLVKNATDESLKKINNKITEKEVKNAIAKLKNKKAPGFDGITNEMIKASHSVTKYFNITFQPYSKLQTLSKPMEFWYD